MTSGERLFSRDELLGGLPARRAASLVYSIENLTARRVVRSRRAMERYVSERAAAQQERAFLEALAEGRNSPLKPSIQDIDRYSAAWTPLIAPDPSLRATIAHQLGTKYRISREHAVHLRAALELGAPSVGAAHLRLFGTSIETVYADRLGWVERLGWLNSRLADRLENLPPFWTAFSLTLTETVGAGVLALPIALAGVGVLPAIGLLVVFGLVNLVTIAALVEAISRNGAMRYGTAYFGRLVDDYLGRSGALVLAVALFAINALAVGSYVIGFGSTLGSFTGLAPSLWAGLLLVVVVAVLRRETLDATVATAMIVGAINIVLLVAIGAIGLVNADPGRIFAPPPAISASTVTLVFGVLLTAYFGHTSAGTAAKIVLARDPSGRSLLLGNLAAMSLAVVLYAFVVLGINGAVPATSMIGFSGTAIEPLAVVSGPTVTILGTLFVVLAMGLASVMCSLGLYNQIQEAVTAMPTAHRIAGSRLRQRLIAGSPVGLIFGAVIVLLALGRASFAGPIAAIGVLAVPILGGVFPMLMVRAARGRGEHVPAIVPRLLGHPVTVVVVGGLYMAGVVVQGSLIWTDPLSRVLAGAVVGIVAVVVVRSIQRGAFRPRAVLEILGDSRGRRLRYSFVQAGKSGATDVQVDLMSGDMHSVSGPDGALGELGSLRSATFRIGSSNARELEVWAHSVSDEGDSLALPIAATLRQNGEETPVGLGAGDGMTSLPIEPGLVEVRIAPSQQPQIGRAAPDIAALRAAQEASA